MSKSFYVDINSILDARAGTIRRINPEVYAELIKNDYHKRKGDFFKGIDPDNYRALYELYEVETLMESTVTNVFHFLYPQVIETMKEFVTKATQGNLLPKLEVNVWPYDMTEDEMSYIRTVVHQSMQGVIGVEVFSRDIAELTPSKAAEKYSMMVMYDFHHYLNKHSDELIRNPQPYLILVAPMVYFNRDPDEDEETIEQLKQGINSLALLEASIASRICLKFVNVDIFSIVYPDDRVLMGNVPEEDHSITIEELDKKLEKQKVNNPET